ncbi:uncharacterized protein LOC106767198 [Vigna radiata var. radiata]|uniref:Uncharacterized protein LOC106767198 n=1 Tax=Vigna radiata var. radiata TaxID=3916 RepID=A0A1S3UN84_VIGRR|nr:uncharacterized protein LOC106767198 [Vigna radiata var. radiata]
MGNSPSAPRLLGNEYYSYDIKLNNGANISVSTDRSTLPPRWKLVYDVDGMTCTLSILNTPDGKLGPDTLFIAVEDCTTVFLLQRLEKFDIEVIKTPTNGLLSSITEYRNVLKYGQTSSGGVTTERWVYGCGTRKGLLVVQSKKQSNEKQSYMVTVAHYYVNSDSNGIGVDIGFSVVVKIGVVNGQLDYSVDGPVEHPSSALLYLIEEVCRTGTWKPSACPHCKNIQSQQRRLLLSESEDSETNLPTLPSYGGQQYASNKGRFNGDGIGSMIRAKNVNFNKWWR